MPSSGFIFSNRSLSIDRAKPQTQFACRSKHILRRRRGKASPGGFFLLLSDNIASASVAPRDLCLFNNSDFYHTQQQPNIVRERRRVRGRERDRHRKLSVRWPEVVDTAYTGWTLNSFQLDFTLRRGGQCDAWHYCHAHHSKWQCQSTKKKKMKTKTKKYRLQT